MQETFGSWDQRTQSIVLGKVDGINVRMHITFLILAAFQLIQATGHGLFVEQAILILILFGIVLLHELGHCYAARSVGGHAHEIVMWPFGGLAMTTAFTRPRECLITTAGGPLANLMIATALAPVLALLGQISLEMYNPLEFWRPESDSVIIRVLGLVWWLNYSLLLLNILPIFPMDGGRALQEVLWMRYGFRKSMDIATRVGIVGSVLLAIFGWTSGREWFIILGVLFLYECMAARQRNGI